MERSLNRSEIITTIEGRADAPLNDYVFPLGEGELVGVLQYRTWKPNNRVPCLWCFFDADDGGKYRMTAWADWNYRPKKSDTSFADDVRNGTRRRCAFVKTKNGSTTWLSAELA